MSASLVGSEMCIRDRAPTEVARRGIPTEVARTPAPDAAPDTATPGHQQGHAAPSRPLHRCPWRKPHPADGCTGARGDHPTRAAPRKCPTA
eukprot:2388102-Alexandrium_andersonii.AAC.1